MKHFLIGLFTCQTLFACQYNVNSKIQDSTDVLHYKFGIMLNDKNDTISGSATVKLQFLQPASSFTLELTSPNKQGKGMKVDSIVSESGSEIKSFVAENDKVNISFYKPQEKNETLIFTIYYHGIPSDGLIISKNQYGDRTFFGDNWPNRAHNWIPCVDDPADKASFEFIVTAPSYYQIISNGIKTEEKNLDSETKLTHWVEDVPLSTKVMVIGAAKFSVKQYEDSPQDIPVSAWVFPQDSSSGFRNYSIAPAIVKFFSNYIAPYPYNKLANVQSETSFGGMENASCIFYDEKSVSSNRDVENLLAHEITHQWFGDMVTEKSFAHLWLSEGFATYFPCLYIESKYGTEMMNQEMLRERNMVLRFAKQSDRPVVDSLSPFMDLLNSNSYQKGSWVLHMLRRQLGDSVFHEIIRSYYATYKGKNADTKDFQTIAEKISGKNLDDFFRQWLYTPGIPQLIINWKYNSEEKKLIVSVEQTQGNAPFSFPLDISIVPLEPGKRLTEKLTINKKKETFTLPLSTWPYQIIADPNTSLLYEGAVHELK